MNELKEQWKRLAQRIDALSLIHRGMVFVAAAALLAMLAYAIVLLPMLNEEKRLEKSIAHQRGTIATLRGQVERMRTEVPADPDAENKARLKELQDGIAQIDETMRNMQKGLVPPEKIASMLEAILKRNSGLRLVQLKTLPVSSMNEMLAAANAVGKPSRISLPLEAAVTAPAPEPDAGGPALYKHGVQVTVQGGYFELMQYVTELEAMPWQVFWGKAKLQVKEYPAATLTLDLYTLSTEKTWLHL